MKIYDYKLNVAVTGGGSLFISDRLTEGGASEYLLEAHVPYATQALEQFVGGKVREKFCSASTARQMALACYQRGLALGEKKTIGVAATCSLEKPGGEREGRVHSIHIALLHGESVVEVNWTSAPGASATSIGCNGREQQEGLAALLIKHSVEIFAEFLNRRSHKDDTTLETLFYGLNNIVEVKVAGTFATECIRSLTINPTFVRTHGMNCFDKFALARMTKTPICIYPGSFNPWHEGHQEVYDQCKDFFGEDQTFLELSVMNFDKPGIDSMELDNRLVGLGQKKVLVSGLTKFLDKYQKIQVTGQPVVFAIGMDTAKRIDFDEFMGFINGEVQFLIFPRNDESVKNLNVYPWLVHPASYTVQRVTEISSTEIRKQRK